MGIIHATSEGGVGVGVDATENGFACHDRKGEANAVI
jgi:hypothetical protein